MEQQHVRQYLEGKGGTPLMTGDGSQARFLRETQQWIKSEDQVSPTHPSVSLVQMNFVNSSLTTLLWLWFKGCCYIKTQCGQNLLIYSFIHSMHVFHLMGRTYVLHDYFAHA